MASSQPFTATPRKTMALPTSATPSPAKVGISEQIETPEKPIEHLSRGRSWRLAYSVKEVRRIAQGLQLGGKEAADRKDGAGSTDGLASLSEKLADDRIRRPAKSKSPVRLPEKYELLGEFFNCMESSIRLLKLRGAMPTFSKICSGIQHLSERRFSYRHLGQLKHLLPEAILIKKVLVHDEATCCMKPELQINLQMDAVEKIAPQSRENGHLCLSRVFRERLMDFSKEHPEEDDVPEEALPHPFNQTKPTTLQNKRTVSINSTCNGLAANNPSQQSVISSHIPQSFQRRFSKRIPISDDEKALACINTSPLKNDDPQLSAVPSPIKLISKPPISKNSVLSSPMSPMSPASLSSNTLGTHEGINKFKQIVGCSEKELNVLEGTPAKLLSTPVRLMTATPEIKMPKRYRPLAVDNSPQAKKSARRSTRTKLFETPTKNAKAEEENDTRGSADDDDVISFLPDSLLQSIREKEKKALLDKEAGTAEAQWRKKIISGLPDAFDLIHLIFQSCKRSTMTKQELIHKIVSSHLKIVDIREVEEQLRLLQEMVPDWISERIASSGDALFCINKISIPEEVRQRLAEAE